MMKGLSQEMSFTYKTFDDGSPLENVTLSTIENDVDEYYDSELASLTDFIQKSLSAFGFVNFGPDKELFLEPVTGDEYTALYKYLHHELRKEKEEE